MSWNYRIGTKWYAYPETLVKIIGRKGDRVFSIIECHYDKKLKPSAYGEPSILNADSVKDLKWIHEKLTEALKKPVLNLDNWPKIYKPKKKNKK